MNLLILGVDSDNKILFYEGDAGYGADSVSDLIGVEVIDVDLSFWGGTAILADGSLRTWSQTTVYGSSDRSPGLQPVQTDELLGS